MSLARRSAAAEWMDDAAALEPDFDAALVDLARINRLTLAHRPVLAWLDALVARTGARRLSVLDVGAGGGDLLRAVHAWGARRGVALELAGLDRSPWAARHNARLGTPAAWIEADLFALDPAARFDAVLCSLFAHHLDDATLVRFLAWMEDRARLGWLLTDLHRHPVPCAAVWLGVRLLRMAPMVVHDSTVSIARGFARAELEAAVAAAGVPAAVSWSFPFRWRVARGPA